MGIIIRLFYGDHEPVHVHAVYGENEIKVEMHIKDGLIISIDYETIRGKFTPAKERELKLFIETYKNAILFAWEQSKNGKDMKFKPIIITKRIKP
ncbi:MAG: DUF4160 domain-containing protein [Bacteroidales bacterium]|nr:DUF4160 domain-containing protein [Bacteroidales bacterium]